ncbi:methyl-CpG-binding domain-containing protein 9 isoform X2 [Malania oleifera]|uniref:methyl-CpG-binding domain-containing protein 9 isoform X2 n=1 Tax=Malania oleifera TaxID=397392 RepID=UPI0025ADDEA8|nr:methyl-CpG-binding domain-containing protein 9 isoform X2 [Malania oleifera]
MMDLNNAATEFPDAKPEGRSGLGIDLNEIPSASLLETLPSPRDAVTVVRTFHDSVAPATGAPAGLPGEGAYQACAACGLPEARGSVVVCDGCERGFHLRCAGMGERRLSVLEEWVCGECVRNGVGSQRWRLGTSSSSASSGRKQSGVRLLDINALPPSDGEGEESEEFQDSRKQTPGDNSFGGDSFVVPATCPNYFYSGNGFGFQKSPAIVTRTVKLGFEDLLHHKQAIGRCLKEALREFISERHGILEEGWRVEFKQSISSCELYAVYCAPDGKTFESMSEVAGYLGLVTNCNFIDPEVRSDCSAPLQKKLHLAKRRKAARHSTANGFSGNKGILVSGFHKELFSGSQNMEFRASAFRNNVQAAEARREANGGAESQPFANGLPVQFEDFYILSLGKVDVRPPYHSVSQIWPIGYKSCWHDKVSGSLFTCDVLDGGDYGPVFRVSRCSCSAQPIPVGSTVLFRTNFGQSYGQYKEECDEMTSFSMGSDEDGNLQTILLDPCPPMENDILSCLGSGFNETYGFQASSSLQHERSGNVLCENLELGEEIGNFSLEGHSSSSVWKMVSQKLIDACQEVYKRTGTLKFFCKHLKNGISYSYVDIMDERSKVTFNSLAKFCSSSGLVNIPSVVYNDHGFAILSEALSKWLDQDRFGLDAEFVQEIIEQIPGVGACSQYEYLNKRSHYSTSVTVENGLLFFEGRGGVQGKDEAWDGLLRGCKRAKVQMVEDTLMDNRCRPLGKPLCVKLPDKLVGDVLQVWELLWRFHEILEIGPLSRDELEEELISPWFDDLNLPENFEKEMQGNNDMNSRGTNGTRGDILSSSHEGGSGNWRENPHMFIQMETGAMKEAAQARFASATYSRCTGVALSKAHTALLKVLVGELQSKVAAIVDPNFDVGESKSKRGRKKDADSLTSKRMKLSMLPINELTWPELARRYILAVLGMDCDLESAEVTTRESRKVYRCLRGDGGVLCGSLAGVAGMEADALFLAEAMKKIYGSLNGLTDPIIIRDKELTGASERNVGDDGNLPEWASTLEPVRKLPTNVGTRIRKCVHAALEKNPPAWARKILEHSISKDVYKGNASGPTKKAVLSVLADVSGEGPHHKSDKERKKKSVSVHDVIMKQCRIVFRRAAAADNAKVFCNLLGRKLMNSGDNDDEGLLGSPAMVSRPLDFRTIDLRLAVGVYGGSQEAFLEDVRELWSNLRTAYGDLPDLVELAETLSQNFEVLYEKEVATLVQKLAEYAKSECSSVERKKEIDDLLVSSSEIPKAPWDEGVCKVCGIDKDDETVLLCDTCDAEYHTYCLNPPLIRIPEGNWYCPSCEASMSTAQDSSEHAQVIDRRGGKKHQGDACLAHLEELAQLAAVMEEKEYWDFSIDERTLLLKFLCDEVLTTALIRQHLEQCADMSGEVQQKLRTTSTEWKNLKVREDILASKAEKADNSLHNVVGEVKSEEGLASSLANHSKSMGNNVSIFSDDLPQPGGDTEGTEYNVLAKRSSVNYSDKDSTYNIQILKPEGQVKDGNQLPMSSLPCKESNNSGRESTFQCSMHEYVERDVSTLPEMDNQGMCIPTETMSLSLDTRSSGVTDHVPSSAITESQAYNLELNSIKNDISLLQDSIVNMDSQLDKLSVRREFLGSDSAGRLYWASAKPGSHPCMIVDESMTVLPSEKLKDHNTGKKSSVLRASTSFGGDTISNLGCSKTSSPSACRPNDATLNCAPWTSYQSDAEIKELLEWLKDSNQKERELKEAILNWQKQRFRDFQQSANHDQSKTNDALSESSNTVSAIPSNGLVTTASALMEKKYGPCFDPDPVEISKKRGRKAKVAHEEKMYRCECLELIWPSRPHCLSCHTSFLNEVEIEEHNDGKCVSVLPSSEKSKEYGDPLRGKGILKSDTTQEGCMGEMNPVEASRSECSDLAAVIKFQGYRSSPLANFDDVCSKFVTSNSNKELVREIGLIGSNGIPSFVPSVSPYLSDSTLMLIRPEKNDGIPVDFSRSAEKSIFSQGNRVTINVCHENKSHNSSRCMPDDVNEAFKGDRSGCLEQKHAKPSVNTHASRPEVGNCCVVPVSSLRPVIGKASQILRQLKINLLDMECALPEEAVRPSKVSIERRGTWRSFVKTAETIFEMVQATIVLEDMIKPEYLRNGWWYWSSLSAAAKTSTLSSLALRIYSLDAAIIYDRTSSTLDSDQSVTGSKQDLTQGPGLDTTEKSKAGRKASKRRKESEG